MIELPTGKTRALLVSFPLHYVRPLFCLVALQMLLISGGVIHVYLNLTSIVDEYDDIFLGAILPLWILLLVYGGICGLYGFFTSNIFAVKQTLACWTGVSILHGWCLLYVLPEISENDWQIGKIAFHLCTDVVIIGFLSFFLMILQAHQMQETLKVKNQEIQPLLLHQTKGYISSMNHLRLQNIQYNCV